MSDGLKGHLKKGETLIGTSGIWFQPLIGASSINSPYSLGAVKTKLNSLKKTKVFISLIHARESSTDFAFTTEAPK
jgi:hypothetical protein